MLPPRPATILSPRPLPAFAAVSGALVALYRAMVLTRTFIFLPPRGGPSARIDDAAQTRQWG